MTISSRLPPLGRPGSVAYQISLGVLIRGSVIITFGVSAAWHQIVQTAVIAADLLLLTSFGRFDEVPNEGFNLFVALIALQAVQQLEVFEKNNTELDLYSHYLDFL
jgi:hypothetical protein